MCEGYCFNEKRIDSKFIISEKKPGGRGNKIKYPTCIDTIKTELDYWNIISKSIDLNKIKKMPTRIGCPDCADGGAEWVEIVTKKRSYRVIFECDAEIDELFEVLRLLRPRCKLLQ